MASAMRCGAGPPALTSRPAGTHAHTHALLSPFPQALKRAGANVAGAPGSSQAQQLAATAMGGAARLCRTQAASGQGPPAPSARPTKSPEELKSDNVKGCNTVMAELQGLDFPRAEVRSYFKYAAKLPKGAAKDFDLKRTSPVVEQLVAGQADAITDLEALNVVQLMLSDIWRWRRRGGGMDNETDLPSHLVALEALQNVQPEQIDRITSSLLDNLPMTDQQKRDMSGSVQQVALAGINGAVWGSLIMCVIAFVVFNFVRAG